MARSKLTDTKARAGRIEPTYIAQSQPGRRARRWLVLLFCAGVLAWLAKSSLHTDPRGKFVFTAFAHSPGRLSAAHAEIERDCAQCHSSNGHGGFVKTVTDTACLKCHDAGIHNINQTTLIAKVPPAAATQPDAAADTGTDAASASVNPIDNHPGGMRSADCVHCHTEHQGEAALRATDSSYCLECHLDLKAHHATRNPSVQNRIVAFDGLGGHPHFGEHPEPGSMLEMVDKTLQDRTRLRFNHKYHNENVDSLKNNCTACHTPMIASAGSTPAAPSDGMHDMQPISFERNCVQCHTLDLVNEKNGRVRLTVSHRDLAIIRGELASLATLAISQQQRSADDSSSWDDRIEAVKDCISTLNDKVQSMVDAARASTQPSAAADRAAAPAAAADPEQAKNAAVSTYVAWLIGDGVGVSGSTGTQSIGSAAIPTADPNLTEVFVATVGLSRQKGTSCAVCHDFNGGDVPAAFANKAAHPAASEDTAAPGFPASHGFPTTRATTQPIFLATVPTGIPQTPRRWFANSQFNHAAHRDLTCYNCHANAWNSTETADFLSPDIDSSNLLHSAQERKAQNIRSCIDCHGPPPSSDVMAAPGDCVTCHVYHDRTKEDSLDAAVREKHHPTTMPIAAAAIPPQAMAAIMPVVK